MIPRVARTAIWVVLNLSALFGLPAEAGMENARFAMHRKDKFSPTKTVSRLCDDLSTETIEPNYSPNYTHTSCWEYNLTAALGASEIYVVIAHAGLEGVAAASFGVDYAGRAGQHVGIDPALTQWTGCANGLQFSNSGGNGEFPAPGGGLRITWLLPNSCANEVIGNAGVHAVVGAFYIYAYSADIMRLTPNNNLISGGPELAVASCLGQTTDFLQIWPPNIIYQFLAKVGIGGAPSSDPCADHFQDTSFTTWGKLKTHYRQDPAQARKTRKGGG